MLSVVKQSNDLGVLLDFHGARRASGSIPANDDLFMSAAKSFQFRGLTEMEIATLQALRNYAADPDWSNVKVKAGMPFDATRIRDCVFEGTVLLGSFTADECVEIEPGVEASSGLYRSTLRNCVVLDNARVSGCELVSSTIVHAGASVVGCGIIGCSSQTSFSNGIELTVVVETGGRETMCYAEMTIEEASKVVALREDHDLLQRHKSKVEAYAKESMSRFTIIDERARVVCVPYMMDCYVGEAAYIRSSQVVRTTLLSSADEPSCILSSSDVRDALIQWGASVDSQSIVDRSLMCTHSHIERHGKLIESILGPFSGVAEGEVSSSLVGPFVGFHHQALLIASYWPAGRGNVGYGANVGSNHTGKAPDQELWPGEGVFFGLGSSIKFPSDFTHAPYSIIATGVVTLPQRVSFPFSLVSSPQEAPEGVAPALNRIAPAWVLSENMFTVFRNEHKFQTRSKNAKRLKSIEYRAFRPSIVDLMFKAREALRDVQEEREYYTDEHILGLGKNYMTEDSRKQAIQTYSYFLMYYALNGLWDRLTYYVTKRSCTRSEAIEHVLREVKEKREYQQEPVHYKYTGTTEDLVDELYLWRHQASVLVHELPATALDIPEQLISLKQMLVNVADAAMKSKSKDDTRGARIIPGYQHAHSPANENEVIVRAIQHAQNVGKDIQAFLANSHHTSSL